jgi:hypothetical protein
VSSRRTSLSLTSHSWAFLALSFLYVWLFPLVSLSSGELKPRGTFIAENAMGAPGHADLGFSRAHLAVAHAAATAFVAAAPTAPEAAAEHMRAAFEGLGLQAAVQRYAVRRRPTDAAPRLAPPRLPSRARDPHALPPRFNVYAVLRAVDARAQDALLFASTYPPTVSEAGGNTSEVPHAAFMLLALAARLREAAWRGKDVVFVLTGDGGTRIGEDAGLGLAAWLRGARYDPLTETALALTDAALTSFSPAIWWDTVSVSADPRSVVSTGILQGRASGASRPYPSAVRDWPSWVRPLAFTTGPFRGAAFVEMQPAGEEPATVAVLAPGAGGRVPDLDLFTVATKWWSGVTPSAEVRVVRSRPGDAVGVAAATAQTLLRERGPPWLPQAASAAYIERVATLARFVWARMWGAAGPHGPLQGRGIPSVTLAAFQEVRGTAGGGATARRRAAGDAAMRVGRALEGLTRSLTGLDERLHATPPFYHLLSSDAFVGLTEYAIVTGLAAAPVLLLVLGDAPSAAHALYGLATLGVAAAGAWLAYAALLHEGVLSLLHTAVGPLLPPASPAARHALAWWLIVGAIEFAVTALVGPVWRRAWASLSGRPLPPRRSRLWAVLCLSMLALGYAAWPLLYMNWPLGVVAAWTATPMLVHAASSTSPRVAEVGEGKKEEVPLPASLPALWLLVSPLGILSCAFLAAGGSVAGEALAVARGLHVDEGALHVPLAGLVLALHLALALH